MAGPATHAAAAVTVFRRLEHCTAQKRELEERRRLLFTDADLEHTITAVNREIERLRRVLDGLSDGSKSQRLFVVGTQGSAVNTQFLFAFELSTYGLPLGCTLIRA